MQLRRVWLAELTGLPLTVLCKQETALHLAAVRGHTRVVRTLLAAGASPLLAEPDGLLPVHVAAAAGHLAATRLLLAAAPHTAAAVDAGGRTPLYLAAHFGALPAVRLLLEAAPQAAQMKTQRDNESPLFVAVSSGHDAVVRGARQRLCVFQHRLGPVWEAGEVA